MSGSTLPNATAVSIEDAKVRDFLLEPSHIDNKGRAAYFLSFGFTKQNWQVLRDALAIHPTVNPLDRTTPDTMFGGIRYRVRCSIVSPDGRNPCVRTLWKIDSSSTVPRFLTAYPA